MAGIQLPIDGLPYLIIFYDMSMGIDANRRSSTDRALCRRHMYMAPFHKITRCQGRSLGLSCDIYGTPLHGSDAKNALAVGEDSGTSEIKDK